MYTEHAVDEVALRRVEASLTHRLQQLDAQWDARLRELKYSVDGLKSSLEWRLRNLESDFQLWSFLPWAAAATISVVILILVGVRR